MHGRTQQKMNSAVMTGGEAIVAGLLDHGIDTVYGLPGAQVYGLFDALHRGTGHSIGARPVSRAACAWHGGDPEPTGNGVG